jgi:hypothetical protein
MTDGGHETSSASVRRGLRRVAARAGPVARAALKALRAFRHGVRTAVTLLLALVILFEEWGWRPLASLAASLARFAPIARLEAFIASLPPYGALVVFALPSLLILPLKLAAVWLIAGGHLLSATLLFAFAKVVGTAFVARIFQLTHPALMQLAWFRWAYGKIIPWKDALVEHVRASWVWRYGHLLKLRAMAAIKAVVARLRPQVMGAYARIRDLLAGRKAGL